MPKEAEKRRAEIKSGIFIIVVLVLLIFSILWLRYFSIRPQIKITAKFTDPGPVEKGFPVYYQGLNIGEVSKVEFSRDFRYTLIHMNIYKKVYLPSNVYAMVRQEGITGQKYIDIIYPDHPNGICLANGDYIEGQTPFGFDEFQKFLAQQVRSGKIQKIITNAEEVLITANQTSKKIDRMATLLANLLANNKGRINTFFEDGSKAATDISQITNNINNFIGDSKTKDGLRSTVRDVSSAANSFRRFIGNPQMNENITETVSNINNITRNVNDVIENPDVKQDVISSVGSINRILGKAETSINSLNTNQTGSLLKGTVQNANQALQSHTEAANQISCLSRNINNLLSQRFLLLRLIFGKPGKAFEQCNNPAKTGQGLSTRVPCPIQQK